MHRTYSLIDRKHLSCEGYPKRLARGLFQIYQRKFLRISIFINNKIQNINIQFEQNDVKLTFKTEEDAKSFLNWC